MTLDEQLINRPDILNTANPDFATRSWFPGAYAPGQKDSSRTILFAVIAFFFWIASVLLIVVVPGIFLLPYLASLDIPLSDSVQMVEFAKTDPTAIILQLAGIIPAHLLTLLLAWLIVTRAKTYSFRKSLGWQSGGFAWWMYPIILGSFMVLTVVVGYFVPEQDNDLLRILRSSRTVVYVVAFVATFTAPLVEEVIYRGVLYSAFERTMGVSAAFLLVTFMFVVVHVPQYYPSYSTIFLLTLLSVILTAIRVKTNNLLPCIILHTIFNGFQSVLLVLEPVLKQMIPEQTASLDQFLK